MSALERYAAVRVPFPFTNRQAQRRRPAVVLSEPGFHQASGHRLLGGLGSLGTTDRAGVAAQLGQPLPAGS
jgi:hypothetical protein